MDFFPQPMSMNSTIMPLPKAPEACRKVRKIFTPEEDQILLSLMTNVNFSSWEKVATSLPNRTARQCRDRWFNYLSPAIRKDPWTHQEDELLVRLINSMGTHWSNIAKYFEGRSDNHIKNRWYSALKHRVIFGEDGKYSIKRNNKNNISSSANNNNNNNNNENSGCLTPSNSALVLTEGEQKHVYQVNQNATSTEKEIINLNTSNSTNAKIENENEIKVKMNFWDSHLLLKTQPLFCESSPQDDWGIDCYACL